MARAAKEIPDPGPVAPLDPIDKESETLLANVGDHFSREDPLSLYNQLPPGFRRTLDQMPLSDWDDEAKEREAYMSCTPIDRRLRKALWAEYALSKSRVEPMNFAAMCEGICSPGYFYSAAVRPVKVYFYLCPPKDYLSEMKDLQDLGLVRLREMINLDFVQKDGKLDPKVMKLVLQAIAMVDMRVNGSPTQKIEQTNRNANLNVSLTGQLTQQPQTMEEIEARLAEVTGKIQGKPMAELTEAPTTPMESILNGMRGQSSKKGMEPALAAEYEKVKAAEDE